MEKFLKVGVITTPHGIRGEMKVFPTTDYPERFEELDYVLMDTGREMRTLHISGVKYYKNQVILGFEEIKDRNETELLRGKELWIPRELGQELGEDEYYIADLLGLDIFTEDGEHFGVLKDVMETGANDVYIVTRDHGEEVLIPAIYDCIKDVDIENNTMTIHIMKGLLDS